MASGCHANNSDTPCILDEENFFIIVYQNIGIRHDRDFGSFLEIAK